MRKINWQMIWAAAFVLFSTPVFASNAILAVDHVGMAPFQEVTAADGFVLNGNTDFNLTIADVTDTDITVPDNIDFAVPRANAIVQAWDNGEAAQTAVNGNPWTMYAAAADDGLWSPGVAQTTEWIGTGTTNIVTAQADVATTDHSGGLYKTALPVISPPINVATVIQVGPHGEVKR